MADVISHTDPTNICNQALAELGSSLIQGFNDGTSVSRVCGEQYPLARDMTLEMHPWNFSSKFARLGHDPDNPNAAYRQMQWRYLFRLPPDCIKVLGTDQSPGAEFKVGADRTLYSDEASVTIEYTARIEDLGAWSPLALEVLVKMMAAKLCKFITGQNSTEQLKLQQAYALLPMAERSDGREGYPVVLRANTVMVRARHGFGRGFHVGDVWRS